MAEPTWRRYKYSGFLADADPFHSQLPAHLFDDVSGLLDLDAFKKGKPGVTIIHAPSYVVLKNGERIPQWGPTVRNPVDGFNPAKDCEGNFTSHKFQANNNCYNYACNVATNSMAQPGRQHGVNLKAPDGSLLIGNVKEGAIADGLVDLGCAASLESALRERSLRQSAKGHFVALFLSRPDTRNGWKGDFHWIRCDNQTRDAWSQKNGTDQATNFDFAGKWISDPRKGTWVVNQGPARDQDDHALLTPYVFESWMFVPDGEVDII